MDSTEAELPPEAPGGGSHTKPPPTRNARANLLHAVPLSAHGSRRRRRQQDVVPRQAFTDLLAYTDSVTQTYSKDTERVHLALSYDLVVWM